MIKLNSPFFIFNPKSYLYGEELYNLIEMGEQIAKHSKATVIMTVPFTEMSKANRLTDKLIICSQHMDGIEPGRGMGYIFPESLKSCGVQATFLNHAEHPMTISALNKAIKRAKELDIITIVCADSIEEARAVAMFEPTIILCEPTELIGTGDVSSNEYIEATNSAIREINPNILIMQAAGISSPDDVYNMIKNGADGTGCTSGIVKSDNPVEMFKQMVKSIDTFCEEG